MIKLKLLLWSTVLFILTGCMSPRYYVLSVASRPQMVYPKHQQLIGVEKITIPAYLYKRQIAVAKTKSEISYLSGSEWGEDLDEGLTHRLISYLQKKFRDPRVYEYPWNTSKQPQQIVKVQITHFVALGNKVYLDANWEIKNNKGKSRSRLFMITVPTDASKPESIVASMDAAFKQLEESIAKGLQSF